MARLLGGDAAGVGSWARSAVGGALLSALLLVGLLPGLPRAAARQSDTALALFDTVEGTITAGAPTVDWRYDGQANEVISLIVVTTDGDLDPVLQVMGPDGDLLRQNDDLDSLVRDAGLEALVLPQAGTYTIRVGRYGGPDGATSGAFALTLTPGYAQVVRQDTFPAGSVSWVDAQNAPLPLWNDTLRVLAGAGAAPVLAFAPDPVTLDSFYAETTLQLLRDAPYFEAGLLFRVQGAAAQRQFYQFKVNSLGEWSVLLRDESGEFVLRNWTADPALSGVERWRLAVLARGTDYTLFANGVELGTLVDDRLAGGDVGLLAAGRENQPDPPTLLFESVLVTARLGTTYRGLPLALTGWETSDPAIISAQIATAEGVTLATERDLFIVEHALASEDQDAVFSLLGLATTTYTDFVLSGALSIVSGSDETACGLVFRWQDERNFSLVTVDRAGGWSVVQVVDAELVANAYDLSAMVTPDTPNNLVIVTQGDEVALYINGALVARELVTASAGRVGAALLNYEDAISECLITNVWVWPLASQ